MKKRWIVWILCLVMLFGGCIPQESKPMPEDWQKDWANLGNMVAAEIPEGFVLGIIQDRLGSTGIYFAGFSMGEEEDVPYEEIGKDGQKRYEAELFLLVCEYKDAESAQAYLEDWIAKEREMYVTTEETTTVEAAGQTFQMIEMLSAVGENPYDHGAAAFTNRGNLAICAEIVCAPHCEKSMTELLTSFLNGLHYAE